MPTMIYTFAGTGTAQKVVPPAEADPHNVWAWRKDVVIRPSGGTADVYTVDPAAGGHAITLSAGEQLRIEDLDGDLWVNAAATTTVSIVATLRGTRPGD